MVSYPKRRSRILPRQQQCPEQHECRRHQRLRPMGKHWRQQQGHAEFPPSHAIGRQRCGAHRQQQHPKRRQHGLRTARRKWQQTLCILLRGRSGQLPHRRRHQRTRHQSRVDLQRPRPHAHARREQHILAQQRIQRHHRHPRQRWGHLVDRVFQQQRRGRRSQQFLLRRNEPHPRHQRDGHGQ